MKGTELCGLICINKPAGFTSFDVIAKLRGILKIKRIGHGGTLDPMAVGVLPVFVGRASLACDIVPDKDKEYSAAFRLGTDTDTQDITGKVTAERGHAGITAEDIGNVLGKFRGDIMQVPPMYSAVSVNGKRLYELARQDIVIERKPRPVTIGRLELTSFDDESGEGTLIISCSAGTYIRTLIADIGDALGSGAVMTSLTRTRACGFSLNDCVTLDEIENEQKNGDVSRLMVPVEKLFESCPCAVLVPEEERLYRNGVILDRDRLCLGNVTGRIRMYGSEGFIGTASVSGSGEISVEKTFIMPENGNVVSDRNGCCAALGLFDGVHLGHRAVISAAVKEAEKRNCTPAVFTFRTGTVSTKISPDSCILTEDEKEKRLREAGAGFICTCDFDAVRDMSPEDFVKRILIRRMKAAAVVCGEDFRFGRNGSGNADMLRDICARHNIGVTVVPPVSDESGARISSGRIREYISAGDMSSAAALMGAPLTVSGTVIHGNHIGRTMGFPTANISCPAGMMAPPFGVYSSETEIDGEIYRSISDIGIKPTVSSDGRVLCETNIFDFTGDIYGKTIRVSLTGFIRGEMKFSGIDELKARIAEDIRIARQ